VFSLVILFSMLAVVIFYLLFIHPRRERSNDNSDVIEAYAQRLENRNGHQINVNQYLNTDITNEQKKIEEIRLSRLQLMRSVLLDYTLDVSACLFQKMQQYDEEVGSEHVLYVPKPGVSKGKDKGSRNNRRRIPNECVICIEPLTNSSSKRLVWSSNKDCQHCFHEECILNWLNRKTKFPNSR